MRRCLFSLLLLASTAMPAAACPALLDRSMADVLEKPRSLCEYAGKVVLVVNTASQCGYTPQYEGLEALYRKYRDRGLVVLGFPSNDFGGQEPGTETQIQEFCRSTYGVKFPMFEKTHAGKADADPLFRKLGELAGEYPKWNFHKYLLDRDGNLAASFGSFTRPDSRDVVEKVESLLGD
jgi:glutathione peroxidase